MNYKTLHDIPDVQGIPVVARLDFNVPIADGKVVDDYRIRMALPTINFLREKGAKLVILSHIEGESDTLKPVFERLKRDIPTLIFCEDCVESGAECIQKMNPGDVLLCENIRLYDGEKKNDEDFAKKLAALGKYYVNDGFSVSHRKHATVVGIPKFIPGFLGLQFEEEIKNLSKAFTPPHPFVFILGGAKFDTKLPLVQKFLPLAETIIIGGALANDIYQAKGIKIGASRVSGTSIDLSSFINNPKIITPIDVVVEDQAGDRKVKKVTDVESTEKIYDAGPESLAQFEKIIAGSKCVLWNGPLGNYENGYTEPTKQLAAAIARSEGLSLVGGGDTLAAIAELGLDKQISFISTGGGAMLDFLAQGTLPGLDALKGSK
jgi:phosphoglycerate kinase